MKPEYIFIVGSFRSGTTLIYNLLNSTDEIGLCWETHFLGHFLSHGRLKEIEDAGDLHDEENLEKVVDTIFSFRKGYWTWFQDNVDKEEFFLNLKDTNRSDKAIFDLFMKLYAGSKSIKGEKTPSHLYYVPKLLEWFPNAKVVHTFRDPRAIFVSELRKKTNPDFAGARHKKLKKFRLLELYILLQVTLTWLRAGYLHKRYLRLYSERYYMVRFEDLIEKPEKQLDLLSQFLNVNLALRLLKELPSNSSVIKMRNSSGLDSSAANRWRATISPWANYWFVIVCNKVLKEFGYQ